MKLEFSRHITEKHLNIKFNENLSSGSLVVPCGRMATQKDEKTWRSQRPHFIILQSRLKMASKVSIQYLANETVLISNKRVALTGSLKLFKYKLYKTHNTSSLQIYTLMVPTNAYKYTKTGFIHIMNSYMFRQPYNHLQRRTIQRLHALNYIIKFQKHRSVTVYHKTYFLYEAELLTKTFYVYLPIKTNTFLFLNFIYVL